MSKLPHREPIGGTVAHIGDCYVWAEIYYLDSPTDYRELLPNVKPLPLPLGGGLVMLDHAARVPQTMVYACLSGAFLALVALLTLALTLVFGD